MDKRDFIWESIDNLSDEQYEWLCRDFVEYIGVEKLVDCILERGYDFGTGILKDYDNKAIHFPDFNEHELFKIDMACGK